MNQIRDSITSQYTVDASGLIRDPGKFESEMLYVPFYWDAGMSGCSSEDTGHVWFFEICTDERQAFPELGTAYGIALEESDQGFVCATILETPATYQAAIDQANETEAQDGEL